MDPKVASKFDEDVKIDLAILKQSYPALMTLFLEASKTDMSNDEVDIILDDCKFPPARKDIVLKQYNLSKPKIRASLALIGRCPPHVVDVDWKLDYNLKNSELNKVMDLKYTISLQTERGMTSDEESSKDNVQFSCSKEQLQDFVGKLKEAVKAVERASQN